MILCIMCDQSLAVTFGTTLVLCHLSPHHTPCTQGLDIQRTIDDGDGDE